MPADTVTGWAWRSIDAHPSAPTAYHAEDSIVEARIAICPPPPAALDAYLPTPRSRFGVGPGEDSVRDAAAPPLIRKFDL